MITAIKNSFVLLAVILLSLISFVGHASAMKPMSHEMHGMKHVELSDTASCATLCRSAIVDKKEYLVDSDEENNDDEQSIIPFYIQNLSVQTDEKTASQRLYTAEIKPPPKIPIYILYSVFRV